MWQLSDPDSQSERSRHLETEGPVAADSRDLPATDATCQRKRAVVSGSGRLVIGDIGRRAGGI